MLPGWASVDDPGLSHLGLQSLKLRISALARRSINNANLIGLQFGVKKFDQISPANGVDQYRALFDRPSLRIHAIAIATDVQANHPRTKRLEQNLGVGRVAAEICDNERITIVAAINRRQRAGTRTSVKPLRQLLELLDAKEPRLERPVAADDGSRTIATAPDIMRHDQRFETGPGIGVIPIEDRRSAPIGLRFWKGLATGTAGGCGGGPKAGPGGTNGTRICVARSYKSQVNGLAPAPTGMPSIRA